jgi:hypothetical protein
VVFSTDGQMQLVMDNGDIVSKGPANAYNPSGSNQEDLGDYLNSGGASSGGSVSGGGISPRSTPPHSTQAAAAPQSVLSQLAAAPPPPDGQVGRTMTGPNGYKAQWNGKQWVLADVNGGQ